MLVFLKHFIISDCNVVTRPQSFVIHFAISASRLLSMFMALGLLLERLVVLFFRNNQSHCVVFCDSQFAMHPFFRA